VLRVGARVRGHLVRTGVGYEPSGAVPPSLSARQKALYRAIDQAQRQRPSVRRRRLHTVWAAQLHSITQAFGDRDFQGQRFDTHAFNGYEPVNQDQRLSPLGNARKITHPLRRLAAVVAARDHGVILAGGTCTASAVALRARLARQYRSFSRGGT
jgi:hypothetical protein